MPYNNDGTSQITLLETSSFQTDASQVALLLGKGGKASIYVTVVDIISSVPDIGYGNGKTLWKLLGKEQEKKEQKREREKEIFALCVMMGKEA